MMCFDGSGDEILKTVVAGHVFGPKLETIMLFLFSWKGLVLFLIEKFVW